jgi:thymidylate synthase ThyX
MPHSAKILCDSITPQGHRLVSYEVTLPRCVLAELNTHRSKSRSSASSRAIPVKKMIAMVQENPYIPTSWPRNQSGMSASEDITGASAIECETEWLHARDNAVFQAQKLLDLGLHKQRANRLLEPFMWHTAIVSATEYSNFFGLRNNKAAEPEFQIAARLMEDLYIGSTPRLLGADEWHVPYGRDLELNTEDGIKIAVARCARLSYLNQDGDISVEDDLRLYNTLLGNGHMGPFEHVARPMNIVEYDEYFKQPMMRWDPVTQSFFRMHDDGRLLYTHFCGNFQGWVQQRKMIPYEEDYGMFLRNKQAS